MLLELLNLMPRLLFDIYDAVTVVGDTLIQALLDKDFSKAKQICNDNQELYEIFNYKSKSLVNFIFYIVLLLL